MSHATTTEDLNTSVGELANLMNDTFTCCMRNYEALLPYLEKKETKLKIYHKLVQINILLNKLNEELVGLRVEYSTVSSYEQRKETVLSVGGRKRKTSDVHELGRQETKSIKTELPFSINAKCSSGSSKTKINMNSDNLGSVDTEETKNTQLQKSDMQNVKDIKFEIQDSNEEDFLEFSGNKGEISAAQTCDTMKNRVTVHFVDNKESASVAYRIVGGCIYDKPTDMITQEENNDKCVPSQNIQSQTRNQESCEGSGSVLSKDRDIYKILGGEVTSSTSFSYQASRPINGKESSVAFTTCDKKSAVLLEGRANSCYQGDRRAPDSPIRYEKDHVPVQCAGEQLSARDELYGIILYENGKVKCTVCNRELPNQKSVHSHVNGIKHLRKQITAKNSSCTKKSDVPDNSFGCTTSLSSAVSCSLAGTASIVKKSCQLVSLKGARKLDDIWKYFPAPFQINEKYFRIHSDKVICSLCNQYVGLRILSIRNHIIRSSHMKRIKRLTNFEVKWKSTNITLMNIPGILNKIIPKIHFALKNRGFFCKVCDCFCDNEVVLNHLTGKSHGKKLPKRKKSQHCKKTGTVK